MELTIINNILFGALKPNQCNLDFMKLEARFEELPSTLSGIEQLFISSFRNIKFNFENERPYCINYLSNDYIKNGNNYNPIDDILAYNTLQLPLPEPTSPKEAFYQAIVKAEILRIKLAIAIYSQKQKSNSDTKYEITTTLLSILKHISYIGNESDTILANLRIQLICFYIELANMGQMLLHENDDYYSFKNLFYKIFDRYPDKGELEIYDRFRHTDTSDNKHTSDEKQFTESYIEDQLPKTNYDIFMETVKKYNFYDIPKLKDFTIKQKKELVNEMLKSIPYAVAMIAFLEYHEHLKNNFEGFHTKESFYNHIAKALGASYYTVKGHLLAYNNPTSSKAYNYSAYLHKDEVEKLYHDLKNK